MGVRAESAPNNRDTDGDGLLDGEEIIVSEADVTIRCEKYKRVYTKMKSHPKMKDTDGDGYSDYLEVKSLEENRRNVVGYSYVGPTQSKDPNALKWDVSDRDLAMCSNIAYVDLPDKTKVEDLSSDKTKEINAWFVELADIKELKGWTILECAKNKITGFEAIALKKDKNIIVAFRGSEESNLIEILQHWGVGNFIGIAQGINPQVPSAKSFANSIAKQYKGCSIYLTGHSAGGYLSQMSTASLVKRFRKNMIIESVSFNAPGPGFALAIINDNDELAALQFVKKKMHHYRIKGEKISLVGYHVGKTTTVDYGELAKQRYNTGNDLDLIFGPHVMDSFYEDERFKLSGRGRI